MAILVNQNTRVINQDFSGFQTIFCADHAIARGLTMTTVGQPLEATRQ